MRSPPQTDGRDPVRGDLETDHLGAPARWRRRPARRPGEAVGHAGRIAVAGLGLPDRRADRERVDPGVQHPDVVRPDEPRVDAERALGLHRLRQRLALAGPHREERAALDVSRVAASDLPELLEDAERVEDHPGGRLGRVELTHDPTRAASRREESTLEHEDVAHALLGEVEAIEQPVTPPPTITTSAERVMSTAA